MAAGVECATTGQGDTMTGYQSTGQTAPDVDLETGS